MRLRYKRKLFIYSGIIFVLFSVTAIVLEQSRQTNLKRKALINQLHIYLDMAQQRYPEGIGTGLIHWLDTLEHLLPHEVRLSVLNPEGVVLYDNSVDELSTLDNHLKRTEIQQAQASGHGYDIRTSRSTARAYLYLARRLPSGYLRVALPYEGATADWLRTDNVFVYWMLAWLIVSLWMLSRVMGYLSRSVERLRRYALSWGKGSEKISFDEDEFSDIGTQIATHYERLEAQSKQIELERERLLQHVMALREGICFFDPEGQVIFFNGVLMQYLNSLSSNIYANPNQVLSDPTIQPIYQAFAEQKKLHHDTVVETQGKAYAVRFVRFEDGGFELVLEDVTEGQRLSRLKREMTSNIAHELRTPVTSIRGYLETCLTQPDMPEAMQRRFVEQAHKQTIALSELIRDISLLTKMDEQGVSWESGLVHLDSIHLRLMSDFGAELQRLGIDFEWSIPQGTTIKGIDSLIFAIFRNLLENALRYAPESPGIGVQLYRQDDEYLYFSFYDCGQGVEPQHLARLFERFYRTDSGRTRDSGGTGLGLSIVKNAVLLHRGDISAKNRQSGGLEYLFRLHR